MPITLKQLQAQDPRLSPEEQQKMLQELKKEAEKLLVNSVKVEFPKPGIYDHAFEMMPYVSSMSLTNPDVSEDKAAIAALQQSDAMNFQEIAASILELSNSSYKTVQNQSKQNVLWSRITMVIGLGFFFASATFFITRLENISYMSIAAGALVEVYAGIVQWQGKIIAEQSRECRTSLDRIQRFIVGHSACESLENEEKQKVRSDIIRKLVE